MIKVDIFGGLGNQIWQYGAALTLAKRHGTGVIIQLGDFNNPNRRFLLDRFCLTCRITSCWRRPFSRLGRALNKVLYHQHVVPSPFEWDPHFSTLPRRTFLAASYTQNHRYLQPALSELRRQLQLRHPLDQLTARWQQMGRGHWVAVHVRRGDYLTAVSDGKPFRLCPASYYRQAMALMRKQLPQPQFLFFSDDRPWVQEHLNDSTDCHLASDYGENDVHLDFALMRHCQSFIIANSSLSAAAALLGTAAGKKVIAPTKWLEIEGHDYNTADFMPPEWQYMPVE